MLKKGASSDQCLQTKERVSTYLTQNIWGKKPTKWLKGMINKEPANLNFANLLTENVLLNVGRQ